MDPTGPTPSSASGAVPASDRGSTAFSGTVLSAGGGKDGRTLEIQSAQGRMRLQAEGAFQAGEKVRISIGGNGAVQVEAEAGKPPGPGGPAEAPDKGYTLPRSLDAFKDLRAFEERILRWMGALPKDAARSAAPGASSPGLGSERAAAFARASLPGLLLQALGREGGREFLSAALSALHPGGPNPALLDALSAALDETEGAPGAKAALAELLRAQRQTRQAAPSAQPSGPGGAAAQPGGTGGSPAGAASSPVEAFPSKEPGAGPTPWFGRIAERSAADGFRFSAGRMGYPSYSPGPGIKGDGGGGPLFRYVLDMGGGRLEAYSAQNREPGDFAEFGLEQRAGRAEVRFAEPGASLPDAVRERFSAADPALRQGLELAGRYLQDFRGEPYFGKLALDFGEVLARSGLLQGTAAGAAPALPRREDVDSLLRLFVSFPRDASDPAGQAAAWGKAVRDPGSFTNLLRSMHPLREQSLLLPETLLRMASRSAQAEPSSGGPPAPSPFPASHASPEPSPAQSAAAARLAAAGLLPPLSEDAAGDGPGAAAAWLRKALPDTFRPEDLARLARAAETPAGREHESAKFLLQAAIPSLPHDAPVPEGRPTQFYFYQGQEWRNLQVTWRREGGGGKERGKAGTKAPLQVRVETRSRHMGRVEVGVSWDPKGARLDFRNQFLDVRELLSRSLPDLEKSLALLGFRVSSWNYSLAADDTPALPGPGAEPGAQRPAGLLDLKG